MIPVELTDSDVFIGAAVVFGIATACQVIAPRLRIPALILLLPAGFIAGQLFPGVNGSLLLGEAFAPLVSLVVALILFAGGMELSRLPLGAEDRTIVYRFVSLGALITWVSAGLLAAFVVGLPSEMAILVGAIVIVSGPTVVGPLLKFARPEPRINRLLTWEGITIDPVGALIAVVVFQMVKTADEGTDFVGRLLAFAGSILVGVLVAVVGVAVIKLGMRVSGENAVLRTQVLVGATIAAAGVANYIADDAGLVSALLMGLATPIVAREGVAEADPFFDTIVSISIGLLFVTIAAEVTPASLEGLVLPTVVMILVLVFVVRPATAYLLTMGTSLTRQERLFLGWMAPRGIVAASTAAGFAAALVSDRIPGGEKLLPIVFMIIVGTVVIYGLTAAPVARLLGVQTDAAVAGPPAGVGVGAAASQPPPQSESQPERAGDQHFPP